MAYPAPVTCPPAQQAPRQPPLLTHVVPASSPPERLDQVACRVFTRLASRAAARKAAKRGELLLDGVPRESSAWVRSGQALAYQAPTPPPLSGLPALELVHCDPSLAVVLKPPGMEVFGHGRSVHSALQGTLGLSGRADAIPPCPVHRLDHPTGGLLLVARTASARVQLGRCFEARKVFKRYRAVVRGRLEGEGEISSPLDGREALTSWRAAACHRSLAVDWHSTLDLFPHTGRTHQLRRHLAELGHPILGDAQHGDGGRLRGRGLFLWAAELRLPHPDGDVLHVSVPPPRKFERFVEDQQARWQRHRSADG